MSIVKKQGEIEDALFEYHSKLASAILTEIQYISPRRIVEIGSGTGTFTMPFLRKLGSDFEILYCVDSYTGPYNNDRKVLESRLADENLEMQVKIVESDAKEMDCILSNIDLVIGHEVLCDLNPEQVGGVILTCFNVLRNGGMFVHSECSPFAMSRSEEMLHRVNEHSIESISDTKWFSPDADELAGIAHSIGFGSIRVDYRKIPIKFKGKAALEMIKRWRTKSEFMDKYHDEIDRIGIEYPMEQILYCIK